VTDDQYSARSAPAAGAYRTGKLVTAEDQAQPNGAAPARWQKRLTEQIVSEARWDGKLARARAHVAIVVVYNRGEHQVIWPHERARVHLHRRPATVYEVNLGIRQAKVKIDLPSRGHSTSFHATIIIHWRVLDPSAIVRHQALDIEELLATDVQHWACDIARDFSIDEITDAQDKINYYFRGVQVDITTPAGMQQALQKATELRCLGAKYGLWASAIAHLTLDKAAIEHNAKMTKLKWALEEEEAEQKLRMTKNKNQQEIMVDKIDVYREIIEAGDIERFALQLASNPGDISAITEIIREDQVTRRKDTIDFIKHMVDSGAVERWEVSDQVRAALAWLGDATARVVTDKHHRMAEIDPPVRQRRRGRGDPIEQTAVSGPAPDVIVASAETIQPGQNTGSNTSSNASATQSEPAP
jgi:hypothetical protein